MTKSINRPHLSQQLKTAIESHGLPVYLIAEGSGVQPAALNRFLSDDPAKHRDIRLEITVEKLAAYFGMEFTQPTKRPTAREAAVSPAAGAIGERIHKARERMGLGQPEAARLAGIAHETWCRAETGSREPSISTLRKIAGALGVGVRDLMPE